LSYRPDESDEENHVNPVRISRTMIVGFFLIASAFVSTVFAQTINIGTNNSAEFGQGYYQVVACDSWIGIQLTPSTATYSGTNAHGAAYSGQSRVKNIQFTGLDIRQCAGKNLKIQLLTSGSATALPLFTDTGSTTVSRAIIHINSNTSTAASKAVTIINGNGTNIGFFDAYEYISYTAATSVYTLIFTYPLALMADVNSVTLESTTPA